MPGGGHQQGKVYHGHAGQALWRCNKDFKITASKFQSAVLTGMDQEDTEHAVTILPKTHCQISRNQMTQIKEITNDFLNLPKPFNKTGRNQLPGD